MDAIKPGMKFYEAVLKTLVHDLTVCEECGEPATSWVNDMNQMVVPGSIVTNYEVRATHPLCDVHKRESYVYDLNGEGIK